MAKINDILSNLDEKLEQYSIMLAAHPNDKALASELRENLKEYLSSVVASYKGKENLAEDEKHFLEICNEILRPVIMTKGSLGFISGMAGILHDVALSLKKALHKESDKDKILRILDENGSHLLPSYNSLLTRSLNTFKQLFAPDVGQIIANLNSGAESIARFKDQIPSSLFCQPKMAALLADCSEYAYTGYKHNEKVCSLRKKELPKDLWQTDYNEQTGQLIFMNGFKVWLGKNETSIIVAFAGTEPSQIGSLVTDFQQLLAPNFMYLYAAGLVQLFVKHYPNGTIYITGHSLGGGLTQFAVTANMAEGLDRLKSIGFNSAGLSETSLTHLGKPRIEKALKYIIHYTTVNDPVSARGALIGAHVVLPTCERAGSGHSLNSVRACLHSAFLG